MYQFQIQTKAWDKKKKEKVGEDIHPQVSIAVPSILTYSWTSSINTTSEQDCYYLGLIRQRREGTEEQGLKVEVSEKWVTNVGYRLIVGHRLTQD